MNYRRFRPVAYLLAAVLLFLYPLGTGRAASSVPTSQTPPPSTTPGPTTPPPSPTPEPTPNPAYAEVLIQLDDQAPLVELIQQRLNDLGYYNYKITDYYGRVTQTAVMYYQKAVGLTPDGVVGPATLAKLFQNGQARNLFNPRNPTPTPSPTPKKPATPTYGTLIEWKQANSLVAWGGGPKFLAKDVRTGNTYYLIRVGGTNHMDVETATAADTTTLKSLYGGGWSWDRRPTMVRFGGKWYAASINAWPHGKETVSGNNMNGQICLHFLNSKTHGSALVDAAHQRCVRIAAGK